MTIEEENKEILKKAINNVEYEIIITNNIIMNSKNNLVIQRHEHENFKLRELKQLLQEYLEMYSYIFSPIINEKSIDLKIGMAKKMLYNSKKIMDFKFRCFFYNINIYSIFENFTPEFSKFIEELNSSAIKKIQELKILRNQEIMIKLDKNSKKEYKPMNLDFNIVENKRQEIIDQANSKKFYAHDLYSSYQIMFNELQDILIGNGDLLRTMYKLKDSAAVAIMNLSILTRTQLNIEEKQNINWIIGAYEKAYRIFCKKYENSDKEEFSTNKMIEYSNNLIQKYIMNNSIIYQNEIEYSSNLKMSNILMENIFRMSFEEIRSTYKKILEEYSRDLYRNFDYYTLQNNFILAIFEILKSRKIIKKDENLTEELKNKICEEILFDELLKKEIENQKTI